MGNYVGLGLRVRGSRERGDDRGVGGVDVGVGS